MAGANGPATEWRAGGAGPTVVELEDAVGRLTGVHAARIVAGSQGRVAEVHVLATRDRSAKQVVRDVQSVLMARFGLELDYRTVSVVQLEEPLSQSTVSRETNHHRPSILRLGAHSEGRSTEIVVDLAISGEAKKGSAKGPATAGLRLVALAVVDAAGDLLGERTVDVQFADVVSAAGSQIALAVVRLSGARGDHVVCGSAVVRTDPNDAMARACLSAMNRLFDSN